MKKISRLLCNCCAKAIVALCALMACSAAEAAELRGLIAQSLNARADSVGVVEEVTVVSVVPDGPDKNHMPDPFIHDGALGHFTWGVDVASGVDLTAHDMTMVHIAGCFGYKGGIMQMAGVGAEIVTMMNNSSRSYPVYAIARTSFSTRRQLCFMELKAGVAFSSMLNYKSQADPYGSLGVGFTLAHSRKFTSHIVLSGICMPLRHVTGPEGELDLGYTLAFASIGLGCAF